MCVWWLIMYLSCFCFKTLDTADAADPQESTATDVESTNTRRGGRGRGRKGTAAKVKATPQVHSAGLNPAAAVLWPPHLYNYRPCSLNPTASFLTGDLFNTTTWWLQPVLYCTWMGACIKQGSCFITVMVTK